MQRILAEFIRVTGIHLRNWSVLDYFNYWHYLSRAMHKGETRIIRWQISHSYRRESAGLPKAALRE